MTGRIRLLTCIALMVSATTAAAGKDQSTLALERSVGRVILMSDNYPRGSYKLADAIVKEYETVRNLPVNQRVRFFWAVLMNVTMVRLDASFSVELVEMIAHDCPEEFERELLAFINEKSTLPPPEPQTSTAKRMLSSLQMYRERLQKE